MNKIYKGYELIKEIAEGNIKEYSEFKAMTGDVYIGTAYYEGNTLFWKNQEADEVKVCSITRCTFELIEDETIDIDSIEKLDDTYSCYFHDSKTAWNVNEQTLALKINKLIDVVQHLNKEIQSIKEKE